MMDYLGSRVQFAQAINAARRIALHEMRGRMEMKSVLGYDEPIFYNGMPTWQPDPVTVGWTPEEREALGFRADGLLEVDGKVVQNTIHHEPPVALQLRVAEMAFPKEYRPGVNSSVDVNHRGTVGIQHSKPTNYSAGPPTVPPPPVPPPALRPGKLPQLGVMNAPDELQIPETEPDDDTVATDDDLEDLLGPEPAPALAPGKDVVPEPHDIPYTPEEQPPVAPSVETPPLDRVIRDMPTAAETPPRQEGILAPGLSTKSIPAGGRMDWERLQSRAALPDKFNRG
jgi:hypothetical protein